LVPNWVEGGVASYYAKKYRVFVAKTKNNGFGIWQKNLPIGYDVLAVVENANENFLGVGAAAGDFKIKVDAKTEKHIQFVLYKNFDGFLK